MIVAYHVIFGMYGFWLPNDPRGSWSAFVASWELFRYGPATKTATRHSLACRPHDTHLRQSAKSALKYPPVVLTGLQARSVGNGFGEYVRRSGLPIWACAILPDHVHLVIGKGGLPIEQAVIQLKGSATRQLQADGLHPGEGADGSLRKVFARGQWKVFLDAPDVPRAIDYVEENPLKEGKPRQRWPFVINPFAG